MNEKQLKRVMDHLAERLVPADVDLWPAIRERFKTSKPHSHFMKGDPSMNTKLARSRRLHLASAVLMALLAAAVLLFATPQGRALAQGFLQFFSRAGSDSLPAPTEEPLVWANQTPGVISPTLTPLPGPAFAGDCGNYPTPRCSVAQIRSKVNFTIKELGTVPDGVYFTGATGGPDKVYILYDTGNHQGFLVLWESPWTGSPAQTQWPVGASAVVETVQIGSISGEYVKGSFGMMAGDPTINWDPNQDTQTLHWVDNGVFIEMQSAGSAMPFDRDGFVALAETLTTGAVAARLTPTPNLAATPTLEILPMMHSIYPLTLVEARDQAGFDLVLPTKLPEIQSFLGASYDADLHFVRIFYLLDQTLWGPNTNGLLVNEERIPDSGNCALCGFVIGETMALDANKDGKIVPKFTTVQIGNVTGQYAAGDWENYNPDTGSWTWNPNPYLKRLRWQTNGMAFELSYWGMELTQADMITIAESLK
jgi:hypothetical protein